MYFSWESSPFIAYRQQSLNEVYNARFVSHPFTPYAAKPGISQSYIHKNEYNNTFDTTIYNTNELGFRFPLKTFNKEANERVILFLGGSTTWDGPKDSLTWPSLLTRSLNIYYSNFGIRVTQINLSLDGGNSAHSLANLILWGVNFNPDLVISYDGINDFYDIGLYRKTLPDYSDAMQKFNDNIRPFIRHFPIFMHRSLLVQLLCNSIDHLIYGDMTVFGQVYKGPPLPQSDWQISMYESFSRNIRCMKSVSTEYKAPFIATVPHVLKPDSSYKEFAKFIETDWQENSITYINMMDSFPSNNPEYHYDPVHFTVTGLHTVANVYEKYIIERNILRVE